MVKHSWSGRAGLTGASRGYVTALSNCNLLSPKKKKEKKFATKKKIISKKIATKKYS